ncbi:MAG: hypothetical protein H0T51_17955 [Pirellulales bacterium]|nr:hypothetical protein [Pirellulales bacterium]
MRALQCAPTLNGIVSEHIAGGDVSIELWNSNNFGNMHVWVGGPDMYFFSGHDIGVNTLFPTDADGYPVVGPEPFSIEPDYTELSDMRPGNNGVIDSVAGLVIFEGSVGPLPGDFNGDGVVDAADLASWKTGFGTIAGGARSQGDADGDHDVDGGDLLTWQRQLGSSAPAVSSNAAVPEPATLLLIIVATASIRRMGGKIRQELVSE